MLLIGYSLFSDRDEVKHLHALARGFVCWIIQLLAAIVDLVLWMLLGHLSPLTDSICLFWPSFQLVVVHCLAWLAIGGSLLPVLVFL